jgi:peroxiredoxin Q/BCP
MPVCTSQVQDYIAHTKQFEAAHAQVVMVYPGPAKELKKHAHEFLTNKQWPKEFLFVTDPDYTMVNAYNLRWNPAAETAYPSTFVIDKAGIVRFAKISHSHGGRTKATETLDVLQRLQAEGR